MTVTQSAGQTNVFEIFGGVGVSKVILLLAMVTAAVAGYFIGAHSGKAATETLARVEEAARQAKGEHDSTVAGLQKRIDDLSADYDREKDKRTAAFEKQKAEWQSVLSGRDKKIEQLLQAESTQKGEISRLQEALKGAISPVERQRLLANIAELEAKLKGEQGELAGWQCSKTAVPADMLKVLREDKR